MDPFRLPRALRAVAFQDIGNDFDDAAAFPNANAFLVKPYRAMLAFFLVHREDIMRQMGEYLFPSLEAGIQRGKIKELFNSIDMDGSYSTSSWRTKQGLPHGSKSNNKLKITVANCGGSFNFRRYMEEQKQSSHWLAM